MNQQAFTYRKIHIYRPESQAIQPLPPKITTHANLHNHFKSREY